MTNIVDITICTLQESNSRYEIIDEFYKEFRQIKEQSTSSVNSIEELYRQKDDETILFCKNLIKTIYHLTINTHFFGENIMCVGGEWLGYLLLKKHVYDKEIIIFPKEECDNNKIQEFVCFLRSIDIVKSFNKITSMYRKEYIELEMTFANITKTVKFYYNLPEYESQLNMLAYNYKEGIDNIYHIDALDRLCSTELIDNIYSNRVSFLGDSTVVVFDKWNYVERIMFADKLVEISRYKNNNIKLSCYSPKFLYNDSCCICCTNDETVQGPIIQLKCSHKLCLDDFKNHVSYIGPGHSKCPSCRVTIDIELYNINDIENIIDKNDEDCYNDHMMLYFNETNIDEVVDENENNRTDSIFNDSDIERDDDGDDDGDDGTRTGNNRNDADSASTWTDDDTN